MRKILATLVLLAACGGDKPAPSTESLRMDSPLMSARAMAPAPVPAETTVTAVDTTVVKWVDSSRVGDSVTYRKGRARTTVKKLEIVATEVIVDTVYTIPVAPLVAGLPFGPYGLWTSPSALKANANGFTASLNYTDATTIVAQIAAARSKGQKLVLAMTACCRTEYATNGNFTLSKWKLRQDRFNTAAIKSAIAAGVSDGTVLGAKMLDEPEHSAWGTGMSKPVVDQMAAYTKGLFPTLPVGVSHGPPGFRWRTSETYKKLDWISYQYNWSFRDPNYNVIQGNVVSWRTAVLAQAAKDSVAASFSLNVLDGGTRVDGCPVPATGGPGTFSINCRMTSEQIKAFGLALYPHGRCVALMWRYDGAFMAKTANQTSFKIVADSLRKLPRSSCVRG